MESIRLTTSVGRLNASQALRSCAHGFGSIVLGLSFEEANLTGSQVGLLLGLVAAGSAITTMAVGYLGERVSYGRLYASLYILMALGGTWVAATEGIAVFMLVALSGAFVTDVLEAGAFITLDQASIAHILPTKQHSTAFSIYFGISIFAGALGVFAARWAPALGAWLPFETGTRGALIAFLPIAIIAGILMRDPGVHFVSHDDSRSERRRRSSRHPLPQRIRVLIGLYGLDSLAGGLTTQAFVVYWMISNFAIEPAYLASILAALSLSQGFSFLAAGPIARRFGVLKTMVVSHAISSAGLILIPFAPTAEYALVLLSFRYLLGNMDVPARQAFLTGLTEPDTSMTAAIGYTTSARYVTRPVGVSVSGSLQALWFGLPFVLTGLVKLAYDGAMVVLFRDRWSKDRAS